MAAAAAATAEQSEEDKGDAFSVPPATFHNECFQHRSIWKIMHKTAMACRSVELTRRQAERSGGSQWAGSGPVTLDVFGKVLEKLDSR